MNVTSSDDIPDVMGAYCMNRYDPAQNRLVGESLTIGFGYDRRFVKTGPRTAVLEDPDLADKPSTGEGISWYMSGLTDFLVFIGGCDGLSLTNIRVENTNSYAMLTENRETGKKKDPPGCLSKKGRPGGSLSMFFRGERGNAPVRQNSRRQRLPSSPLISTKAK